MYFSQLGIWLIVTIIVRHLFIKLDKINIDTSTNNL